MAIVLEVARFYYLRADLGDHLVKEILLNVRAQDLLQWTSVQVL
jgi:hypothetical protein